MKARERHDTLAAEPRGGATDGLGRQSKVPRNIQPTHRKFDTRGIVAITALEHAQEHGNACARPEARQDDLLTLRFPQFVRHLDEKLQLELAVAVRWRGPEMP